MAQFTILRGYYRFCT